MQSLTWSNARAWRLNRHLLLDRAPAGGLAQVAAELAGIHAQVMSSAELALGLRVHGTTPKDVREALWQRRTLVKTWAMRGTLHLFPAAEFPMWVAALGTRAGWQRPPWLKAFGVTVRDMDAINRAVRDALDGQCLTREELAEAVARRVSPRLRPQLGSGWGALLKPAAGLGYLCSGPSRGRNVTFVRPDQWVKGWREADPEASLAEILRRFAHAYGPITHTTFAQWWGSRARRLWPSIAGGLEEVSVEGERAYALPADVAAMGAAEPARSVFLLGGFDPLTVGSLPRTRLVPEAFKSRVSRTAGWISPVLLIDGAVAGVWEPRTKAKRVAVRIEPFRRITASHRKQAGLRAQEIAAFTGTDVEVSFGPLAG
jgi:hypothetical protein